MGVEEGGHSAAQTVSGVGVSSDATGTKHDDGKPPLELVPREAVEGAARALGFGADKYDRFNFMGGIQHSRMYGAALRHIFASFAGEDTDPESGLDPIDHALASLVMLKWMRVHRQDLDDRPPRPFTRLKEAS